MEKQHKLLLAAVHWIADHAARKRDADSLRMHIDINPDGEPTEDQINMVVAYIYRCTRQIG